MQIYEHLTEKCRNQDRQQRNKLFNRSTLGSASQLILLKEREIKFRIIMEYQGIGWANSRLKSKEIFIFPKHQIYEQWKTLTIINGVETLQ